MPVPAGDLVVLVVLLLSGLLAFARGFIREVLSIAGWIGAALAAVWTLPWTQPFAQGYIGNELFSQLAAGVAVFIVTLVVLSVISHYLANWVKDSALNAVDRSLGFLFGLFRGAVLICLVYLLASLVIPPPDQPTWVTEARSQPLVARGAVALQGLLPDQVVFEGLDGAEPVRQQVDTAAERRGDLLLRLEQPQPAAPVAQPSGAPGASPASEPGLTAPRDAPN